MYTVFFLIGIVLGLLIYRFAVLPRKTGLLYYSLGSDGDPEFHLEITEDILRNIEHSKYISFEVHRTMYR